MKALRKARPDRGAQLESVPVPSIGPNDVLVRVRAASICGTDLHILKGDVPETAPGTISLEFIKPTAMMQVLNDARLATLAADADGKIERALKNV